MSPEVIADDGCRLWTAQSGTGPPLLLCHGGPGLWDYLEPVANLLNDLARTVRWDQRSCGRSERRGPHTVARSVADLDAIRQHLGAQRIDLLGHSWGASLALRYALEHPDWVNRLIYVSGTGIDPEHTWKSAFRHTMSQRIQGADAVRWRELDSRERTPTEEREYAVLQWSAEFVDPTTARQHAERMATPWLGINWDYANSINTEIRKYLNDQNVAALCRALGVATLIIDGDQDPRPRWAVDSLHQALPNAHRVTLAGAGHLPWVEDPDGFRQAVAGFVSQDGTVPVHNPTAFLAPAEPAVDKDQQFNGFRQIWTERADGVFHGPYTVYWDSGAVLCMRGRYVAGAQEGVWTYWDRDGRVDKQIRFHNDEPGEARTSPPWLDEVSDQDAPDTNTAHSPRTPDPQ